MYKKNLALDNLQWLIRYKNPTELNLIYLLYMYKKNLALNNQQWLICHKTKPNETKPGEGWAPPSHFWSGHDTDQK